MPKLDVIEQGGAKRLDDYADVLSVQDMHAITGLSERVIREQCASGGLPAVKIGWRWFVPKNRFIEYIGA